MLLWKIFVGLILFSGGCFAEEQQVPARVRTNSNATWTAKFLLNTTTAYMESTLQIELELKTLKDFNGEFLYQVKSKNDDIAKVEEGLIRSSDFDKMSSSWHGNVSIKALFLGKTEIYVERVDLSHGNQTERATSSLKLIILREVKPIDHIFKYSIILLCCLLYINFGAALDMSVLKTLVRKPIGPSIGFCSQVLVMPLLSYGLGYAIFPESPEFQLGLFFTGVSPSGGASNMWTVILNGNINLSVLMTTLSNFAAFVLMPFWLFTLGANIFEDANIAVPYRMIVSYSIGLVIPLLMGLAIQKCSSRFTTVLVRLLKPISSCLLIFIVVFAIVVNFYLFQLFTWQIIVAGFTLPFLGYLIGWLCAKILGQQSMDALTIAIETGIQNTGISIFMLKNTLAPPDADITTVIPVAVAVMTPLPLLGIYLYNRIANRNIKYGLTDEQVSEGEHIQ